MPKKKKAKKSQKKSQYQWVYTGPDRKAKTSSESTSKSAPDADAQTLAQTPLHQKFFDLQEDRQWLLKQIRRKRTELNNFMEEMRSLASEIFKHSAEPMKQIQALDEEIHALFKEIFETRKFGKKSRQDVERVYRQLQQMGVISYKPEFDRVHVESDGVDFDPEFEPPFGDEEGGPNFGAGGRNPFHAKPSPTPDTPDRDMRQTFLRLAAIYHPDRAEDEAAMATNTEIMKEINRAYKDGDFARLLELEKQQQAGELDVTEFEAGDDLERACQKLERENGALREQYEGIKAELRSLRNNTQEGEIVKTYRQAKRAGLDMFEQMVAEAQEEIDFITDIRNFVQDFRDRKITIKAFLKGPSGGMAAPSPEEMLRALEEMGIAIQYDDF